MDRLKDMMRLILTLKHWQILLLLLVYEFLGFLMLTGLSLPGMVEDFLFSWVPITVYPLLLGLGLNKYFVSAGQKVDKSFKVFLGSGIVWTTVFLIGDFLKNNSTFKGQWEGNTPQNFALAAITLIVLCKFIQFP